MAIMRKGVGRREYTPATETFALKVHEFLSDPQNPNEMLVRGIRGDTGAEVVVGLTPPGPRDAQRKSIFDFNRPGKFQVMPGGLMRIDRANLIGDVYRAHYAKMLRRHEQDNEMFQRTVLAKPMIFHGEKLVNGVKVPAVKATVSTMSHQVAASANTVEELEAQIVYLSQRQYAEKMARHGGVSPIVHVREQGTPYIETFNVGYDVEDSQTQQLRPPTEVEIRDRLYSGRAGERWKELISNADNGNFGGSLEVVTGCAVFVGRDFTASKEYQNVLKFYDLDAKSKIYKEYEAFCRMCGAEPAESQKCYRWSIVGLQVRPQGEGLKVFVTSLQPMNQHPKMINGTVLDPKVMGITEVDEAANQSPSNDLQPTLQRVTAGNASEISQAVTRTVQASDDPRLAAGGAHNGQAQVQGSYTSDPVQASGPSGQSNHSTNQFARRSATPDPEYSPPNGAVSAGTGGQVTPVEPGGAPVAAIPEALGAQLDQMTGRHESPDENSSLEELAKQFEEYTQDQYPSFN